MKQTLRLLLLLLCLICGARTLAQSPSTVLVVGNANNLNSVTLAHAYAAARQLPPQNLLLLNLPAQYTPDNVDTCSLTDYTSLIAAPIYAKINTLPHIDYIVLCRNLPVKIQMHNPEPYPEYNDQSVDSCLAGNSTAMRLNPYYGSKTAFSSTTSKITLVTRLDGWAWADAFALITNATNAKPGGLFLFDQEPDLNAQGYTGQNYAMGWAQTALKPYPVPVQLDTTSVFVLPTQPLGAYLSWGSTDDHFSAATFASIQFQPGAIAETFVFSSAINLRFPQPGASNGGAYWNDSQISTLIHSGVTGVNGYVAAAYVYALCYAPYLYPNYAAGRNLAEAFYSSFRYLGWKGVVIGDPLCAPYQTVTPQVALPKPK